jgi:hypothetical protein
MYPEFCDHSIILPDVPIIVQSMVIMVPISIHEPLAGQVVQQLVGVSDADSTAALLVIAAEYMEPSRGTHASVGQVRM